MICMSLKSLPNLRFSLKGMAAVIQAVLEESTKIL